MAWKSAVAYVPAAKAPVKMGVVKIESGVPRVSITMNGAVLQKLGSPAKCNVFIGDGDEDGQVLLQFDADGPVDVRALALGGARLQINDVPGMGNAKRKPVGVFYEEGETDEGVKQLTIRTPW